jgi:catechol 2,3-dioxygenase
MYAAKIGHAHLKVRDLGQAIAFYTHFLGLTVSERLGNHYAFLTSGELHHELALQALGPGAGAAAPHAVGLYHVAFEVPDKYTLRQAYDQLVSAGVRVSAVDHLISWALYFADPDGNGLELYCDTRHEPDGHAQWAGHNLPIHWPESAASA